MVNVFIILHTRLKTVQIQNGSLERLMVTNKILIIDDEKNILESFKRLLRNEDFKISTTTSPEEAIEMLEKEIYAAVVSDQNMPAMDGIAFLEKVRKFSPDSIRIMLTGYANTQLALQAINRSGVYRLLTKPLNRDELIPVLKQAISMHDVIVENRRLNKLTQEQNINLIKLNRELSIAREHEIEVSSKIQQTLLWSVPPKDTTGISIGALTHPSQRVDGDFFDFYKLNEHTVDILVGDVMGKGIPAALIGAATKNQFLHAINHLICTTGGGEMAKPEEIVGLVHETGTRRLIELESFVTLCYARFDLKMRQLDIVDCGHTKTIRLRKKDGFCGMLQSENIPLGFSEKEIYRQVSYPFDIGDLIFFYSDGVTEARDQEGNFFGEERLVDIIKANSGQHPDKLVNEIRSMVVKFSNSEEFSDDLTCVAVKIMPDSPYIPLSISELKIDSDMGRLADIRNYVNRICRESEGRILSEEKTGEFVLAVNEAVVNVIKHGYDSKNGGAMKIETEVFEEYIAIRLYHRGKSFDPNSVKPPLFDGSQDGGYGLHIISKSVDGQNYSCDENGLCCVCLIKEYD
jgi:sigma-B regulation protein RsbU (phosphoserine phosphatase)